MFAQIARTRREDRRRGRVNLRKIVPGFTDEEKAERKKKRQGDRNGDFAVIPFFFEMEEFVQIDDLDVLPDLYESLRDDPHSALVLGRHLDGSKFKRKDFKTGKRVTDTSTVKRAARVKDTFGQNTRVQSIPIDIDGMEYLAGWDDERFLRETEECVRVHVEALLGHVPDCLFVTSSKSGVSGRFRGHLWVLLAEPRTFDEWKRWQQKLRDDVRQRLDGDIDAGICQPTRILWTCRPKFRNGLVDPFEGRPVTVRIKGDPLKLIVPPQPQRQALTARQTRYVTREMHPFPVERFQTDQRYKVALVWARRCAENGCTGEDILAEWRRVQKKHGLSLDGSRLTEGDFLYWGDYYEVDGEEAEPAFEPPTMNAEQASRFLHEEMLKPKVGVELYRVTPGVGKSETALHLSIQWAANGGKVVYLCPTRDLAKDMFKRCSDLLDDPSRGWPLMNITTWFGKDAFCDRAEQLAVARRFDAEEDFCKTCDRRIVCPFFNQFERLGSAIHFAAHAMMQGTYGNVHPIFDRNDDQSLLVIIDEGFVDQCSGQGTIPDLKAIMERPTPEGCAIGTKTYLHLTQPDVHPRPSDDELQRAVDLEMSLKAKVRPEHGHEPDDLQKMLEEQRGEYRGRFVALYIAMLEGGPNRVHVYQTHPNPLRPWKKPKWKATVSWQQRPLLGEPDRIVLLDATPNVMAVRQVFHDVVAHEVDARFEKTRIVHVHDLHGSRAELLNAMGPEPREDDFPDAGSFREVHDQWTEAERHAGERREVFASVLRAQPNTAQLLATRKDVHEAILCEHPDLLRKTAVVHYGALEGKDAFQIGDDLVKGVDIEAAFIEGRPMPPPHVVERAARKLFADDPEPIQELGWYQDEKTLRWKPVWYPMAKIKTRVGKVLDRPEHPDERVQAVLDMICRDQLNQALQRLRPVRSKEWRTIYVLHRIALPCEVDEMISYAELQARRGPLQLLSKKQVGARLDTKIEPDMTFRVIGGAGQPCRAAVACNTATTREALVAGSMLKEQYGAGWIVPQGRVAEWDWEDECELMFVEAVNRFGQEAADAMMREAFAMMAADARAAWSVGTEDHDFKGEIWTP